MYGMRIRMRCFPGCDLYVPVVVGAVPGQKDSIAGNTYAVSDTQDICGWIIQQ